MEKPIGLVGIARLVLIASLPAAAACARPAPAEPRGPDPLPCCATGSLDTHGSGADRIGVEAASLLPRRWVGEPAPVEGHVTLVRWWTDGCPYCERSLPAIERLRTQYASAGLATVAVYHPKPPRPVRDEDIRAAAERIGYHGSIAVDEGWESLRKIWLDTGERSATSVSFVLDRAGRIRFVHPGPEVHPSVEAGHEACDADYGRLDAAIRAALAP